MVGSLTFDTLNSLSQVSTNVIPLVPAAALHFGVAVVVAVLLIFVVGPLCLIGLVHLGHIIRIAGGSISPFHTLVPCTICGYRNLITSNEAHCSECQNPITLDERLSEHVQK